MMLLLWALLAASLAVNVGLLLHHHHQSATCKPVQLLRVLDKTQMDLYTPAKHQQLAQHALEQAAAFSGKRGEGQFGWLNLLKAFDHDPTNIDAAENLAVNYAHLDAGYAAIAYSTLAERNMSHMLHQQQPNTIRRQLHALHREWKDEDPGPPTTTTLAFTTAVSQWNLTDVNGGELLNQGIYKSAVQMYKELRRARPDLSPTELNHELWNVQRQALDRTGTYWGQFHHLPGFTKLVLTMRAASYQFLHQTYGVPQAELKASHPLVVWVSVHTTNGIATSTHQPHVTMDALVGGVYYVRVPRNSGRLQLFDPRGKSPLTLVVPEAEPVPPFHRTIGVEPREGKLVLFPGWLVHGVMPGGGGGAEEQPPPQGAEEKEEFRVSLSLNLKGEWQTTAALAVDVV